MTDITRQASLLKLARRTVAADCNNDEFELFIHTAKRLELDPLAGQIYAFVFNKDKPWRKMSIVVSISGLRAIAARSGAYFADDAEPEFHYNEALKNEKTNPLGIERVTVKAFKGDRKIVGVAYWDEYAPIVNGELNKKTQWPKMPRVMIAKCAEANALRKGWPEHLSQIYEESELDKARADEMSAVQLAELGAQQERSARLGGPAFMFVFHVGEKLTPVPVGEAIDRILAHVAKQENSHKLQWFQDTNAESLNLLWAHDKSGSLEIKKAIEAKEAELKEAEQ